jgi:hypothetical protein
MLSSELVSMIVRPMRPRRRAVDMEDGKLPGSPHTKKSGCKRRVYLAPGRSVNERDHKNHGDA